MDEFKDLHDEAEEMFLCLPCAKRFEGGEYKSVKSVKIGAHVAKKGDCDNCYRRRFGYKCKVEFNWEAIL